MHLLRNNWVFITFLQMCLPASKVHYKKLIAYFSEMRIALCSFLTLLAFDAHPSAMMWMFCRWRAFLSMMSVETVTLSLEILGEHLSSQIAQSPILTWECKLTFLGFSYLILNKEMIIALTTVSDSCQKWNHWSVRRWWHKRYWIWSS